MLENDIAVFGIYGTVKQAKQAVNDLRSSGGFSKDDLSVFLPDSSSSREIVDRENRADNSEAAGGTAPWNVFSGSGNFQGKGLSETDAKRYVVRMQQGGIIVSAHCRKSEDVALAKGILERTGAEDISSAGQKTDSEVGDVGHAPVPLSGRTY